MVVAGSVGDAEVEVHHIDERRLGHFKLDGLVEPALIDASFEPLPTFEAAPPQSDDTLLLAV